MKTFAIRLTAVALAVVCATGVDAMEIDTGNPDLNIRWDNTFRYGLLSRLKQQDAAVVSNPNFDDGDRNFNRGIVSNRLDILSELDVTYLRKLGARVSAAGWYDSVYNTGNDNPGRSVNQTSVPYNRFTRTTRTLEGRDIQARDAFVYGKFDVADGLTVRLGQYALMWGESLFLAGNAIAGVQSPIDISRLVTDPTAQAKDFAIPVPQISGQLQLTPNVSVGAYYQFKWRPSRLPAVGSYFSFTDLAVNGAENFNAEVAPNVIVPVFQRGADMKPKDGGQFGLQLRWRVADTDLGLYALRFHDKVFQQVLNLGVGPQGVGPTGYYLTWPQDSQAYGVSASHTFGDANVAAEASLRRRQALTSSGAVDFGGHNNTDNPAYATGDTAHVNVSVLWTLPVTPLWRDASFTGEMAWTRMLKCRVQCSALDPNITRDAVTVRGLFAPTYAQALPGVDLSIPISIGYTPGGSRSAVNATQAEKSGDLTLALDALYERTWRFNLSYTHFVGPAGALLDSSNHFSYRQVFKDRDFLAFTVRRTL
jgi:hypothetical protein